MHKRDTFQLPRKTSGVYPIHSTLPLFKIIRAHVLQSFSFCENYQKGIVKDDDPEFLHQYRVTMRRIRAILSLHQSLFIPEQLKETNLAIKSLMQPTNLQRDLDVYLMQMEHYFYLVEHKHHQGLARFFDDLQHQRQKAYKKNKHWLKSEEYKTQYKLICIQLKQLSPLMEDLSTPPQQMINTLFVNLNNRIITSMKAIDSKTSDAQLHRLRIKYKKLRYGLEYYHPLTEQLSLRLKLKTVKFLQAKLGDFNDSSVQIDFLNHYLEQYKTTGRRAKAIGLLLQKAQQRHLENKQQLINEVILCSQNTAY
ncbi:MULTISPECIES: CHAD domain-containing protein [unclassified Photobacterium]|uniref:CHAD domain-containing protein n=1 Tax=unclassified Photobacterium TaxID=2628852 RepID=UPI000D1707C4|nr:MULTISPECIES: CHAD domain-containing protein [unclassified Photobacterium]PSV31958.1 metal-binding protein [Photobacterium sp. GB-72]PSV35395.1 metal-binding protein [Photobacterium sp. GB-27]PSV50806.1 metal-binding protein [Photobacterium sp. GB-1]PSW74586.1 metal-binding protein [Photobacterium sp. GB-50]